MINQKNSLKKLLDETPYLNYVYSYPHKTTYSEITPAIELKQQWKNEDKSALFLYFHIPFCEMRCGFCNLFTTSNPKESLVAQYLNQLEEHANQIDKSLEDYQFSNLAIGGGTPTYLTHNELKQLFSIATDKLNVNLRTTPVGIETSPATVTEDRLQVLKDNYVNRISLGVESFSVEEANAMGRPQKANDVETALKLIQQANFDTLNIDLIYGGEGQTVSRWLESVHKAIDYKASEIYLYPLYVRPLTGLGRKGQQSWDDHRLDCYHAARETLIKAGYQQVSMRMFYLPKQAENPALKTGEYHCQEDGMIGLGCGARSYTHNLHYSSDYAVGRQGVLEIIENYNQLPASQLAQINYGFTLNLDEQQRRYILLSLLQCEGLSRKTYQQRFGEDVLTHYPELTLLQDEGLATIQTDLIKLNTKGISYSDVIGSWLFSDTVKNKIREYSCR